ncbi:MAG: bifunctional alpha,alpha-trehalose-phosphate synthase (UDP-forming)/trehalose-phosphatase [Candidatus Saccharimonadales bacterium]
MFKTIEAGMVNLWLRMQAGVVIVSNRLPLSVKKVGGKLEFSSSVGGLATGLNFYTKNKANKWIGWPGIASNEISEDEKVAIAQKLAEQNCYPVFLTQNQIENYYLGYSNSVLWPLFHGLPFDHEFDENYWKYYRDVNKLFSQAVLALGSKNDAIWVHDYQMLATAEMLRAERPDAQIGFFLHIPFPAVDAFAELPQAQSILKGMLGADLIGFHTSGYSDNFLDCCEQLNVGAVKLDKVTINGRTASVSEFPMGIDYDKFADAATKQIVQKHLRRFKRLAGSRKVILTVDRLDPTKGFLIRLKAYQEFLRAYPKFRGKVIMMMVAVPSRGDISAYKKLRKNVEKLVEQINDEFGTKRWQPINYMATSLPFEELAALYQLADVAFVVPLRDGMNLVAKEYIASQPKKDGVLILSQTAGAAEELQNAITVDPLDNQALVEALKTALSMSPRELHRRLGAMQRHIAASPVQDWAGTFMKSLKKTATTPVKARTTRTLNSGIQKKLLEKYSSSAKRLLLLDYDGVLAPFVNNPDDAKPSKSIIKIIEKLAGDKVNNLVIISGRSAQDLDSWFGDLPINLGAEHGALIKTKGQKTWQTSHKLPKNWQANILPILQKYAVATPGAFVEQKTSSLVWHFRQASPYYAQKNLVILKKVLIPIVKPLGLKIYSGNKILEIKHPAVNKGAVAWQWLKTKPDFILALGDDYTDEDTFVALPKNAWSVKVGRGRTRANYRLSSTTAVEALLKKLAG